MTANLKRSTAINMTKENQSTDLGHTEKEEVRGTPGHQVFR